jgi:flagella basal body P-ring formation protein FlgA
MTRVPRLRSSMIMRIAGACALTACAAGPLAAAEMSLPVPTVTIYPGDTIRDPMIADREVMDAGAGPAVIDDRLAIVGKVARRTLLPGKPIPVGAVEDAKVVSNGAQVRIVFQEGGLVITTYAAALQNGRVGDLVRVRNLDSGVTVSGTVLPDGSVRVSGG